MIEATKIEDLIKERIPTSILDSRGFYSFKCQCCNDYKVRAGFKFLNGEIGYNCWNCGTTGRYTEFSQKMSKNFRKILTCYGISNEEIDSHVRASFFTKKEEPAVITLNSLSSSSLASKPIKLPEKSFKLGSTADFSNYQSSLIEYLLNRKIDLLKYDFYFNLGERFTNRIIIPFYRDGKIIYWQARSIDPKEKKRYDNAPVSRDNVLFNYDGIFKHSKIPLIVTEGVFDAMMFDGVAVLGSKLTDAKVEALRKSSRDIIFIIDKDSNGRQLAEKALGLGWKIAFSPEGTADLNDSVAKFGKIFTAHSIIKNCPEKLDTARLLVEINCKDR